MTVYSLEDVRTARPLVFHLTNNVTVNDCANVTICTGGSPIMCDSIDEIDELIGKASAVVLNIGTVNKESLKLMIEAGLRANDKGLPVVLDPVGVGASSFRKMAIESILNKVEIALIKGNASEISFLAGSKCDSKGVDSLMDTDGSLTKKLASRTGSIVCMTGKEDYISDGKRTVGLSNGSDLMEMVSGTGCMLTSICACFLGACGTSIESVIGAVSAFNIAGELAEKISNGPGTFKSNLFDCLASLDDGTISDRKKIE